MGAVRVGVVGAGLMGAGIAQVAASSGHDTTITEVDQVLVDRALAGIAASLAKLVERKKIDSPEREAVLARLHGSTRLEDLAGCDVVIEAVTENLQLKQSIFARLDALVGPNALLATNTSSLSVTAIASATTRPGRVAGLHFFNPVPAMKLVELIPGHRTEDAALERLREFAQGLGKTVVQAKDTPGFVVNLLLVPYLLEAVRAYERGVATAADIDQAMVLGCGHPMGPLALLDFVGLDTTYYIANILFEEFREPRYAPPPLLHRMVLAGELGRKSGKGFFTYDP